MRIGYTPKRIRTTLLFWFLIAALVPLFIITGIAHVRAAYWSRVLFLVGVGIVVSFVAIFLARTISRPIIGMIEVARKMQAGDFSDRYPMDGRDEIGSLARSLNAMADAICSHLTVQQGSAEIMCIMVGARDLQEIGENLLQKLIDLTHSDFGAFFVINEDENTLKNSVSIGVDSENFKPFVTDIHKGIFGKTLSTQSISIIRDIPPDTILTFITCDGTVLPKEIITVPLIADLKVVAVIALVSLHEYLDESMDILNRNWGTMNAAISNLITNEKTRQLVKTLNVQNVTLQTQVEAMHTQSEQLRVRNEELEAKLEQFQKECSELQVLREQLQEIERLKNEAEDEDNDICLSHPGNEEIIEETPSLPVQKDDCELVNQEMKLGEEKSVELEACSSTIGNSPNNKNGMRTFRKKLKRLMLDGIRLRCREHFSKDRCPGRMTRVEKKIKKFIEADTEDILPF